MQHETDDYQQPEVLESYEEVEIFGDTPPGATLQVQGSHTILQPP